MPRKPEHLRNKNADLPIGASDSGLWPTQDTDKSIVSPLDSLVVRYRVQRAISSSLEETMFLTRPVTRAAAYLDIAESMMVGRMPVQLMFDRAIQEIASFRASIKTHEEISRAPIMDQLNESRVAATLLMRAGTISFRGSLSNTATVMEQCYNLIGSYDDNVGNELVRSRDSHWSSTSLAERKQAKIADLVSLAKLLLELKFEPDFSKKVVEDIDKVILEPGMFGVLGGVAYLDSLNQLLALYVLNDDLSNARRVVTLIESIPSDPKKDLDSAGNRIEADRRAEVKISGQSMLARFEAGKATNISPEDLSDEDVRSILASGNGEAIVAIGFSGRLGFEQIAGSNTQISDTAMKYLLRGINERLIVIQQFTTETLKSNQAKMVNLEGSQEKEQLRVNPLTVLDELLMVIEDKMLEPLETIRRNLEERGVALSHETNPKINIFGSRLALREVQRALKKRFSDIVTILKQTGKYETQDGIFDRLLSSMTYYATDSRVASKYYMSVEGYYPVVLQIGPSGDESVYNQLTELVANWISQSYGNELSDQESDMAEVFKRGRISMKSIPGTNLRMNHDKGWHDDIVTITVAFNSKAVRGIIESENLPNIEWSGDISEKPSDNRVKELVKNYIVEPRIS